MPRFRFKDITLIVEQGGFVLQLANPRICKAAPALGAWCTGKQVPKTGIRLEWLRVVFAVAASGKVIVGIKVLGEEIVKKRFLHADFAILASAAEYAIQ